MGCIDHPAGSHEDANMSNVILAIAVRGPEDQIACLGFGAGKAVAHSAVVLSLGRPGNRFPLCFADSVLSESCMRLKLASPEKRQSGRRIGYRSSRIRRLKGRSTLLHPIHMAILLLLQLHRRYLILSLNFHHPKYL